MRFSPAAHDEMVTIEGAIREVVDLAIKALIENDQEVAKKVEPLEELIDNLCDEMKHRHIDRLQMGICTLQLGYVFNDLLTNYERISDHCSNIAVAVIELENDSFDTHKYLESLTSRKDEQFASYYKEYEAKYHLKETPY